MLKGTGGKLTGEAMYDSRLFNQSAGMDAGFGGEDEYNTYTKPLFDRAEAGSIYRPRQSAEDAYGDAETQLKELSDTSRFKADKGFRGAEQSAAGGKRDAPVQFERGDLEGRRHAESDYGRGRDQDNRDDRDGRDRSRERSPDRRDRRGRDEDRDRYGERDRDRRRDSRDRDRDRGDRDSGSSRRRGDEGEDPFGIRDIVDDSARKRSRRDY